MNHPPNSLLGLPAELRNDIYAKAIGDQRSTGAVQPGTIMISVVQKDAQSCIVREYEPGVLRACKQLRRESIDIFYNQNYLIFTDTCFTKFSCDAVKNLITTRARRFNLAPVIRVSHTFDTCDESCRDILKTRRDARRNTRHDAICGWGLRMTYDMLQQSTTLPVRLTKFRTRASNRDGTTGLCACNIRALMGRPNVVSAGVDGVRVAFLCAYLDALKRWNVRGKLRLCPSCRTLRAV